MVVDQKRKSLVVEICWKADTELVEKFIEENANLSGLSKKINQTVGSAINEKQKSLAKKIKIDMEYKTAHLHTKTGLVEHATRLLRKSSKTNFKDTIELK